MKQKSVIISIPVFVVPPHDILFYNLDDETNNVPDVDYIIKEHLTNLEVKSQASVLLISQSDIMEYYLSKIALITAHYYEFHEKDRMIWAIPHKVEYNVYEDSIEIFNISPNEDKNAICMAINYGKAKYGIPYKRFTERIKHNYASLLDWYNNFMHMYF